MPLYDSDYFAWTESTAARVRERRFDEVDAELLAEEIEDLGRSVRRALESRVAVLLAHLLKWQHQPGQRSRSWNATIREQQRQINKLLAENPSLRAWIEGNIEDVYQSAVLRAVSETGLPDEVFPAKCPISLEEALAADLEF